ncbi:MAG: hypothetical protein DRN99_08895 [Thermoproteota archaeon]|nr:MAG: hypothetical protein DRN99_08895 [Candidatus Korarchaeota archaeon]
MKITSVIPAYNEEKNLLRSVLSLLKQTRLPDEVIVVDDGSVDRTGELASILAQLSDRVTVVSLGRNTGNKALALKASLEYISGDVVVCLDADSELDPRYIEHIERRMKDPRVAAVSGRVVSRSHNLITHVRQLEYTLADLLFKRGQDAMETIIVVPGVGGAIRADLFGKFLSADTVAEDMDLTFSVHEAGFKVVYEGKAIAYTQDPPNIRSYMRQIRRWYSGAFQCLKKHYLRLRLRLKLYLAMIIAETLVWAATITLAVAKELLTPILSWIAAEFLIGLVLAYRSGGGLSYLAVPLLPFFRFLNLIEWIRSMVNELMLNKKMTIWLRADRYEQT